MLRHRVRRPALHHRAPDFPSAASQSFSVRVLRIPDREPVRAVLAAPAPAVRRCGRANVVVRIRRALERPECVLLLAREQVLALERLLRLPDVLWAARHAQDSATCRVE